MPAELVVKPSAGLNREQGNALEVAAKSLPDGWTITAEADPTGDQITVRVAGGVSAMSRFAARTRPEQFAAFLERVRVKRR